MKKLQEIVRVVGRKRLKRIEIFNEGGSSQRNSNYYKLYKGIKEGRFTTDEEAAMELFGCEPSDKKYLMLKSRVKTRLINTLFFLETSASRYEQAIYRVNRNFIAARFLLLNGARNTGISMLKSTLHEAEKYGITEVAVECLKNLRFQAGFGGNQTDFHRYNEKIKKVLEVYFAEIRVEEYLALMALPYANSFQRKAEMAGEAMEYIADIAKFRKKGNTSHNLELMYFRLCCVGNQIAQDYHKVLVACDQGEAYLKANPQITMRNRYGEFAFYRMISYMHLGDSERGSVAAQKGLPLFMEGSVNWMIFQEYHFLLCMHSGNYDKSWEIYTEVVGHQRFAHLDENRREKWRIFEGFLKYITGGIDRHAIDQENIPHRFNIWKFLNEVPIFSKDKRGLNIAILILQVLFLLDRQDYDGIISRAEALKVYCSRYLKRDEDYRSNCFLKMVLLMEKQEFQKEETRKLAEKYFVRLKESQFNYQSGNLAALEIIPYEQLWLTILNKLKR